MIAVLYAGSLSIQAAEGKAPSLAVQLDQEDLHELAALEFRRAAEQSSGSEEKAGFLAGAAWEYMEASNFMLAEKMLDQAETHSSSIQAPSLLMRGQSGLLAGRLQESRFIFTTLCDSDAPSDFLRFAESRLGCIAVKTKDLQAARIHLDKAGSVSAVSRLELLEASRLKSPRLGGFLGLIPGLGYAYSGEYANAFRSLLLNGIFIYGMADTAGRDHWGAFTALTFFEITWYSGSIYGGVDAAHRFNRRQEQLVIDAVEREFDAELDIQAVPAITLQFSF